jgi:hypothetical protein
VINLKQEINDLEKGPNSTFEEMRENDSIAGIISCCCCIYIFVTVIITIIVLIPHPNFPTTYDYLAIGMWIALVSVILILIYRKYARKTKLQKKLKDMPVVSYSEMIKSFKPLPTNLKCNLCRDNGICNRCNGLGKTYDEFTCEFCEGTGICSCKKQNSNLKNHHPL